MKYFIFTLLFALQVLGQNTRVLPRGISIPSGSVLVGGASNIGTTTPVGTSGQFLQSSGTGTPVWKNIQGGLKNYITNGDAESSTTGWATYADSAGAAPVDGTGGSPNVTWTTSSTTPLELTKSFIFTKDAANRQGNGVSYAFTIDRENQAKVMNITASYLVNSGTFVAGSSSDLTVWIYDVTNATLIQPSSYTFLSNGTSVADKFSATFQTASNSTSYRLIFHVSTTSASAYSLKLDSLKIGPSNYVYGTPITDWQSYTPSWTGSGGSPSLGNGTLSGRWRRVGQNAEIQIAFTFGSTANANSATAWQFSYPSGLAINTASLADGGSSSQGSGLVLDSGTQYYTVVPIAISAGIRHYLNSTSPIGATVPMTWANGDYLISTVSVPVLGWSSSVQMSDQADTRVVAAYKGYNTPTGTLSNSYNVVKFSGMDKDTHSGYNASTGLYTVPVSGYYRVSSTLEISKTSYSAGNFNLAAIYVNGSPVTYGTSVVSGTTTINATMVSGTVFANAGDTIGIYSYCSAATGLTFTNTAGGSNFSLERISGPSAIAATESVGMSYHSSTGQAIGSSTTFLPTTKVWDSHGAFNTSTGEFTCPISGKYLVTASNTYQTWTGSATLISYINVAGVSKKSANVIPHSTSANWAQYVTGIVDCNAGQKITAIIGQGSGSNKNLSTNGYDNYFDIIRVGN